MAINNKVKAKGLTEMFIKFLIVILYTFVVLTPIYGAENTLLVFRNSGTNFEEALKGLSFELSDEFDIKDVVIDKKSDEKLIKSKMEEIKPNVVVLMDNKSINLYKTYQSGLAEGAAVIPSVSIMGVLIDKSLEGLKNSTGILYEIPIVSSAVNLRSLIGKPINKIGVVHRAYLADYLKTNNVFLKNEGIELKTVQLETAKNYKKSLKAGLKKLLEEDQVDVIWVPNDNSLLAQAYFQGVWFPALRKYKVPLIVGVEVLVQPNFNFGSYAVLPDHVSLGSQAAELIYDIMDNDWQIDMSGSAEQPISIYQIVNLKMLQKKYEVPEKNLSNIDKVLR